MITKPCQEQLTIMARSAYQELGKDANHGRTAGN